MTKPKITFSVLMPLFYKENPSNLDLALRSIYQQTLMPNEIVLIKEGTLGQELKSVIEKWQKIQTNKLSIRVIDADQEGVIGLPACLNLGLNNITTDFIARFDSDDENCSDRFEKQIHYLEENSEIVLLGGQIEEMDELMVESLALRCVPMGDASIKKFAKWRNPFNHQSVMYKTSVVKALGGYPIVRANEDYALWGKFMANGYQVDNLSDVLVKARTGEGLYKRRRGVDYLKGEIESINSLYDSHFYNKREYCLQLILRSLIRLLPQNGVKKIYGYLRA